MVEGVVMSKIELAYAIALVAHKGQVDKVGVDYINHPLTVSKNCTTEREKIVAQLSEIQCAIRDLITIKKSDEPKLIFFTDIKYTEDLSYSFSLKKLIQISESTEKARLSLLRNANVKLTVINYLSELI